MGHSISTTSTTSPGLSNIVAYATSRNINLTSLHNNSNLNSQALFCTGASNIVSAAEICTIEQLKAFGIFNNQSYISNSAVGWGDLKTFNRDKDNTDNRTKSLCKPTLDGTEAHLNCIYQHGVGYIRKPGDPNTCITYSCPPGFEQNGLDCIKTTEVLPDSTIDKRSKCDERWSDWFMTPNYHLGNKLYQEITEDGYIKCYDYCPTGTVPSYANDPVDGSKKDFSSTDNVKTCIDKSEYFSSKYNGTGDYCPIAWIHRLNSTPDNLKKKYDNLILNAGSNINTTNVYANLKKNTQNIVNQISIDAFSKFENIQKPSDAMQQACNSLNSSIPTKDLIEAWNICDELHKSEENVMERLSKVGYSSDNIKKYITMMKQSCNGVFCNQDDNNFDIINKEEICFPNPGNIEDEGPAPPPKLYDDDVDAPTADDGFKSFMGSIFSAFGIFLIPIFIVLFYYFYIKLWPYIRKFLKKLSRLIQIYIFRRDRNILDLKGQQDDILFEIEKLKQIKLKGGDFDGSTSKFDEIDAKVTAINDASAAQQLATVDIASTMLNASSGNLGL